MRRDWIADAERSGSNEDVVAAINANLTAVALLDGVFGNSPFLARLTTAHPDVLASFTSAGPQAVLEQIHAALHGHADDGDLVSLMRALRIAKQRAALAIALADLSDTWSVDQVVRALSAFGDLCVRKAVAGLLVRAQAQGKLSASAPESSGYVVLGVGKLGAHELNYSSDIDLFVLFDPARLPYIGKKSPQEFAVELTKELVRVLAEHTGDGYVFRTDLRLRPDPGSTSIAVSQNAAQSYYESYGQNWERAALIKARFIAGDATAAQTFLDGLKPFIWRKSLDFYALQDIHSIKRQIYAHKGGAKVTVAGHNIKLGRGGIREIEFFAQTQQLIWGGRLPETRVPDTLGALDVLCKCGFVTPAVRDDLTAAYRFLRRVEHRLQMIADEQTQTLPAEPAQLAQLAAFLGYPDRATFERDVEAALRAVETHYAALFEDAPSLTVGGNLVFTGTEDDPDTMETLRRLGFRNPSAVGAMVRGWHHGRYRATRSNRARQLMTEIMPALLIAFGKTVQPDAALVRFDQSLAQLSSGVQLLATFQANPALLDLVAEIMGDAPRLAELVTRSPALLDYVLEPQFHEPIPATAGLVADLELTLAGITSYEAVLDVCRRWANDQRFRIGVQLLRGQIAPETAAGHFCDTAEAVLRGLTPRVESDFTRQYGQVPGGAVALMAYGKLGSRELTPTSDLDLVVVYDSPPDAVSQGGPKSLSAPAYYLRLVQRLVSALTLLTREGTLYSVDLRLRPDGDKGPIATSLAALTKYHRESAWTWEHMALTRARVVFGPPDLAGRVQTVVHDTLARPRDPDRLRQDVADMRARMRKEHPGLDPWDIKHRPGGMIDAEFLVEYHVLRAGGAARPAGRGMVAAVHDLVAGRHLPEQDGAILARGLLLWLRLQVMLRLTLADDLSKTLPLGLEGKLAAVAGVTDFEALHAHTSECAAAISQIFQQTFGDRRD